MGNFFHILRMQDFFEFFNTNDISRKMVLEARLIDWLMVISVANLIFYFRSENPVFRTSSATAVVISLLLILMIKLKMI